MNPPSPSPHHRGGFGLLMLLAALGLLLAACSGDDSPEAAGTDADAGSEPGSESATEAGGQGAGTDGADADQTAPSTLVIGETDGGPIEGAGTGLVAWSGVYLWDEFVEGDPGSDQTVIHELILLDAELEVDVDVAEGLPGRLMQYGFQTSTEFTVAARPIEGGLAIDIVSVDVGLTPLEPGDTAFTLTGDPTRPLTTLIDLTPPIVDQAGTGTYFLPESETETATPAPDLEQLAGSPSTFWAIEAASYDLVEIEVATGQEVGRVAGWGDVEGSAQALTSIEAGPAGWLWADDCCEPAAGNVYGFDPDRLAAIGELNDDDQAVQTIGLNPVVSPDAQRVAYGNYSFDVTIIDRTGSGLGTVLDGSDVDTFPTPVAWLDDQTLVVAETGTEEFVVSTWDVSDPGDPAEVGTASAVPGLLRDALRWDADTVLVVVESDDESGLKGLLINPVAASVLPVEVPLDLATIDADPSGRFVLHVGADGLVRAGAIGDPIGAASILSDIEVVAASW